MVKQQLWVVKTGSVGELAWRFHYHLSIRRSKVE